MNKLQQLLNEKYPDVTEISHIQRQAFTEGYNAAKAEEKSDKENKDILARDYNPNWDHSDFRTIQ